MQLLVTEQPLEQHAGEVAFTRAWQNDDDGLVGKLRQFSQALGGDHSGTRADPGQNALFLHQATRHVDGIIAGDLFNAVQQ